MATPRLNNPRPPSNSNQQIFQDACHAIEVKVPVLPESVSDATIATWNKKAGDAVARDENLVDLETDKVVLEVPSPVDGILKEIRCEAGATVNSQQIIAIIEEGAAPGEGCAEASRTVAAAPAAPEGPQLPLPAPQPFHMVRDSRDDRGVDPSQVEGTGRKGAVTKEDIVNYARSGGIGGGAARKSVCR